MTERIPVFKPHIGVETVKAAVDALEMGWLGMGSYVGEFEARLAEYLELRGRHVVAVNTGTSALHLAMLVAGVQPGDEVLTPSFNNIGDFQAIKAAQAEPVFCDVDERTLGIDVEKAERLIGLRTRAIIGMDYDGIPCALDELEQMAARHGLVVIHDAAHSLGSRLKGRSMGNFGDISVFSFDPVKLITCIDGGALVVDSEETVAQLQRYRLLGMDQSAKRMYTNNRAWTYDVPGQGFRYHLANLHAAIGLTQLAKIDEFIISRRRACRHYNAVLSGVDGLVVPQTDFDDVAPFLYYIRVLDGHRDALIDQLKAEGIDTGIHWIPGHRFSFLKEARRGDLSVTDRIGSEILTLPLHSYMDLDVVDRVATAVRSLVAGLRRKATAA
ncbi:MAG TPA: DegT/DnrJ/EryC1/StrS family aminotransferase [Candidatus Dormibacteraeota bacterium]|nr:DegT/DnrJ/EryC1/StrS family aminotransferase [Candidatus Dormibacteraeota bacterium]